MIDGTAFLTIVVLSDLSSLIQPAASALEKPIFAKGTDESMIDRDIPLSGTA